MTTDFGSFKWLTGDVNFTDYGGKWIRKVGSADSRRYHILSLENWVELVGEREASEVGATYCVDLSEVDLDAIALSGSLESALRSCGMTLDQFGAVTCGGHTIADPQHAELALAEACHSYGCKAPLWDANGNNYRKLMREARAFSRSLDDSDRHSEAMERPVNAIGTSAADFMCGRFGIRSL
jgi:hypothetical protein